MKVAWYERFRLAGYVRFLILNLRSAGLPGPSREGARGLNTESFLALETLRLAMLLNDHGIRLAFERKVRPALEKAAGLCADRQIAFVLALAPDQAMVESDLARDVLDLLWESGRLERSDRQRYGDCRRTGDLGSLTVAPDLLAALGTMEGVWVVDLWQKFREAGKDGGLYLERDTHWSQARNEPAAALLMDTLRQVLRQRSRNSPETVNHGESKSNSPTTFDGGDSSPPAPRMVTR